MMALVPRVIAVLEVTRATDRPRCPVDKSKDVQIEAGVISDVVRVHGDAHRPLRLAGLQEPIGVVVVEPCADQLVQLAERAALCGKAFLRKI